MKALITAAASTLALLASATGADAATGAGAIGRWGTVQPKPRGFVSVDPNPIRWGRPGPNPIRYVVAPNPRFWIVQPNPRIGGWAVRPNPR